MADDTEHFDLELGTKADTTGLEKTEAWLSANERAAKDVEKVNPMSLPPEVLEDRERENELIEEKTDALKEAAEEEERLARLRKQQEDDVAEAKRRVAQRDEIEAENERQRMVGRIARMAAYGAAIQQAAALGGQEIRALLEEIEEIDPALREQFAAFDDIASLMEDPLAESLNVLKSLAGDLMNALAGDPREAIDGLRESAELWASTEQRILGAINRELETQLRHLELRKRFFDQERELRAAEAATDTVRAAREDAAAIRGGADPNAVRANRLPEELLQELAALERAQAALRDAASDAQIEANDQANNLRNLNNNASSSAEEIAKAEAAVVAAKDKAIEVQSVADQGERIRAERERDLLIQFGQQVDELAGNARDALSSSAEDVLDAIEQQAAEQSGELSATARSAMNRLVQVLEDGVIQDSEIQSIEAALANLRGSLEGRDRRIVETMERLVRALETTTGPMRRMDARILRIEQQLRGLR